MSRHSSSLPFVSAATAPLTRRHFLRLGLALPLLSASVAFPMELLAASGGTIAPVPLRKPRAPRLLMLDPGHGGYDPGTVGAKGTHEKDVTLDVARRMAEALSAMPGVDARLTRDRDEFLPLTERVKKSRDVGADLFLSIHADSAPNSSARGLSAYTLSAKGSDAFASQLAEKENNADVVGGLDLSDADQEVAAILFDLTARRTINTAQRAKVGFIKAIGKNLRLLENPMRSANFVVLRAPDVPSMLIETGFLSNRSDEAILSQPKERQKIAQLMAKEIAALLDSALFG